MLTLPPADELAEIRAQIARLRLREAELATAAFAGAAALPRGARPGWPIRRHAPEDADRWPARH